MKQFDLVVVGAGPAGLAAAYSAWENGVRNIAILERDKISGGILNQCIHNGFGLHYFKEELTGPEYAQKFVDMVANTDITVMTDTMVLEISEDKKVFALNSEGYFTIQAKSIILAMGCRERTRGAIAIPGHRPVGIYTAGTAQRYVNMEGYMVGKRVVILGSGDIGLIMARRMKLEGAEVLAVVELMPYSNGLNRNIVQCLNDYDIPLYLSHTVTDIYGETRLEKVVISKVDENRAPIAGSEIEFDCDTLLLSVGLIPENELSKSAGIDIDAKSNGAVVFDDMQTSVPGIFACGNVLHVHDLVDFVTEESIKAGKAASEYIKNNYTHSDDVVSIKNGNLVSYNVPQHIDMQKGNDSFDLFFRVTNVLKGKSIVITSDDGTVLKKKKKAFLLPAEMEKVLLDKSMLKGHKCITVSIED